MGILVDLNDSVTIWGIHLTDKISMDTVFFAGIQEWLTAVADQATVIDLHARLGQGNGLIDALSAKKHIALHGGFSLAG